MFRAKTVFNKAGLSICLGGALMSWSMGSARAMDDTHVCLSSYVDVQALRRDGRLRAARMAAEQCGRGVCPAVIRNDCVRWQGEIDEAIPTVVLSARTVDGRDVMDVRVWMDGVPLLDRLDGRGVAVDPGPHTFRFVRLNGAAVEERVLVHEAEHDRSVVGRFGIEPGGSIVQEGTVAPLEGTPSSRPVPKTVWILGGVGVSATAVAVTFWSVAAFATPGFFSELSCRPNCPAGSSNVVYSRAIAGDVAGGVALLTLGTAAYLYFRRPPVKQASLGLSIGGGATMATWLVHF